MEFRTYEDLNRIILENLSKVPKDIDIIVGIPRSGLMVASIIALYINKPLTSLDDFLHGDLYSSGTTKPKDGWITQLADARKVLIVEDSINSGASIATARKLIQRQSQYADRCIYLAAYASPESVSKIDIAFEILPQPRVFQWNFMQHMLLKNSCCDIDGVLCDDPTEEENDDGEKYKYFLLHAREKLHPARPIHCLVTSRLEKYRPETEHWLQEHHIVYDKLVMMNMQSAAERRRIGNHAAFKAKIYSQAKEAILFIESNDVQAREIFNRTNKPVFCVDSQKYYCDHIRESAIVEKHKRRAQISRFIHKYRILIIVNDLRKKIAHKRK